MNMMSVISLGISVDSVGAWQKDTRGMEKRQQCNKDKLGYLRTQGYKVVAMRECDYQNSTLDAYLPSYYQHHKSGLGEAQILEVVRKINLYGMFEVDIEVPECLWEHFLR